MATVEKPTIPNESYDWDEAYARLYKQTEQANPDAWIPDENDSQFMGVFRSLKRAPSKFGMTPVAIFEEPKSGVLRSVWLHHTVLKRSLYELQPKAGETVLIRYMGREVKEDGTDYANYRVAVDRPHDQGMSWEQAMSGITEEELMRRNAPADDPGPDESYGADPVDDDIPF